MRIVISGTAGSGKSAVARELAKRLGYKYYSMGDFIGEMAVEEGISLLEISKKAEKSIEIDKKIDEKQKALNNEDNFIVDSRLGIFFIKDCVKIFLDADLKTRAKRIMNDVRKDEKNTNLKETIKNMKKREKSEMERWNKKYYHFNCYDKTKFDKVIDTTSLDIEDTVEMIMGLLRKKK